MKSLTVRLDDERHKEFKVALAKNGQKAQEVFERAVKEYIEKTNTDFPKRD
jgi:predicted transcriptional regulator